MLVVSHSVAGCCFDCVCIRSPDFNLFVSGKVVVFFFDAAAAVIVITLLHQLKWKLQNVFHDARHVPRRCRYKRKRQQQYAVLHGHGGQSGWISPEATICALCPSSSRYVRVLYDVRHFRLQFSTPRLSHMRKCEAHTETETEMLSRTFATQFRRCRIHRRRCVAMATAPIEKKTWNAFFFLLSALNWYRWRYSFSLEPARVFGRGWNESFRFAFVWRCRRSDNNEISNVPLY